MPDYDAIIKLKSKGRKNIRTVYGYRLCPKKCPRCHKEGLSTFSFNNQRRNEKWIARPRSIRLDYYHGYGKTRCYIGIFTGRALRLARGISISDFNLFDGIPVWKP